MLAEKPAHTHTHNRAAGESAHTHTQSVAASGAALRCGFVVVLLGFVAVECWLKSPRTHTQSGGWESAHTHTHKVLRLVALRCAVLFCCCFCWVLLHCCCCWVLLHCCCAVSRTMWPALVNIVVVAVTVHVVGFAFGFYHLVVNTFRCDLYASSPSEK